MAEIPRTTPPLNEPGNSRSATKERKERRERTTLETAVETTKYTKDTKGEQLAEVSQLALWVPKRKPACPSSFAYFLVVAAILRTTLENGWHRFPGRLRQLYKLLPLCSLRPLRFNNCLSQVSARFGIPSSSNASSMIRLWASLLFVVCAVHCPAKVYYVATNGNDSSAGTLAAPFRTIQTAASLMKAGDTCYIRQGIYRESVKLTNSGTKALPIVLRNYSNETVTISGCDLITGWQTYSNRIECAKTSLPVQELFLNGNLMIEARYPNISLGADLLTVKSRIPIHGWADANTNLFATTTNLTRPDGAWNGASLVALCGYLNASIIGRISSSSNGAMQITNACQEWLHDVNVADGTGYIVGSLCELDMAGEWFFDTHSSTVYLWPSGKSSAALSTVEGKVRNWGLDLCNQSFVNITNLNFFACSLTLRNSTNCNVSRCTVRYPRAFFQWANSFGRDDWKTTAQIESWQGTGVEISGTSNVLEGAYVAHSWGDCVTVWGKNHLITNCIVEDADWAGIDCAPVSVTGESNVVTRNTIRHASRCVVLPRGLSGGSITYNDISDGGLYCVDCGLIYTYSDATCKATDISYNWLRDNHAPSLGMGIYLDHNASNKRIHHNVITGCLEAIRYNTPITNLYFYNNTLWRNSRSIGRFSFHTNDTCLAVLTWNNFGTESTFDGIVSTNNYSTLSNVLTDPGNSNFTPLAAAALVNSGLRLSNLPPAIAYSGSAPDIGAYEFISATNRGWVPGAFIGVPVFTDQPPTTPGAFRVQGTMSFTAHVEAEAFDAMNGVEIQYDRIGSCDNGDWVKYGQISLGTGGGTFRTRMAAPSANAGQTVQVRVDATNGPVIATLTSTDTGGWDSYAVESAPYSGATGTHDIYILFVGKSGIGNFDWFEFQGVR
jgi:hypothetical protein